MLGVTGKYKERHSDQGRDEEDGDQANHRNRERAGCRKLTECLGRANTTRLVASTVNRIWSNLFRRD